MGFRVHLNPRVSKLRHRKMGHFMIAFGCAAQGLQDLGVLDLGFGIWVWV